MKSLSGASTASVPQRSPLRYPGGKSSLVPLVRRWLASQPERPHVLVEPFAGGASISLLAAAEDLTDRVVMVELDPDVAALWRAVLTESEALAEAVETYELTRENVLALVAATPSSDLGRALRTIVRNRVNRGGILAARAGMLKEGERGKGLASRWYPETLAKRIRTIGTYADRIELVEGDGIPVLEAHAHDPRAVAFVDPPYTAGGKRAGRRLYTHHQLDHERLFEVCTEVRGDVLLTYDDAKEVRTLAVGAGMVLEPLSVLTTHGRAGSELLLGRDLTWAKEE